MATKMTKTTVNAEESKTKTPKKKYEPTTGIECKSITSGELFMVGSKSNLLYKWADYDDVQEVEYQDLLYDVRSSNSFSKYPRFIVLDEDFVEQNSQLEEVYQSLYTINDLRDLLNHSASELRQIIPGLPKGAQDSLKHLASTGIRDGSFDSVTKIKVLDELFDTQMLLTLVDN